MIVNIHIGIKEVILKNNINTMKEFAEFLDKNDLVYAGKTHSPFSKLIGNWKLSGFMTISDVENKYNVNLKILEETL